MADSAHIRKVRKPVPGPSMLREEPEHPLLWIQHGAGNRAVAGLVALQRQGPAPGAVAAPHQEVRRGSHWSSICRPWRCAYYWKGYYEPAGEASEVLAGERVEASPGWAPELPALEPPPGDDITMHVTVDFAIVSGDSVVPVQVQHLPAIPEPYA